VSGSVSYFLFVSFLSYSQASSFLPGGFAGMGAGIAGLAAANYYMNIIPD